MKTCFIVFVFLLGYSETEMRSEALKINTKAEITKVTKDEQ
jgi:hypothetical protein